MNASIMHKIISTSLSLLVLVSSMSLTIEKHFCGGELVDVAVFSKVDSCCSGKSDSVKTENSENGCCNNEVEIVEGITDLTIQSFDDFEPDVQLFIAALAITYFELFEDNQDIIPHRHYRPPILIPDIHVLNETYLI